MNISFEDFSKLDIRIGTVVSVEKVANADKLLKFTFDVGEEDERQIMAGLAEYFDEPQELVGKQVPLLLNIEPRTLRGHESQGMILATDGKDRPVFLRPETQVPNGSKIR